MNTAKTESQPGHSYFFLRILANLRLMSFINWSLIKKESFSEFWAADFCASPPSGLSGQKSALSSLKSAYSGLKSTLSGLKSTLLDLKSALSDLKSVLSGL